MKALLIALLTLTGASMAHADGFRCQTADGDLNVKIYNNVDPSEGTRTPAIMVLSHPDVSYGNKTIASFKAEKNTLTTERSAFVANVDLRVSESSMAGKYVGGTRLGELGKIVVSLDFSYSAPVVDGEAVRGTIEYYKRNGDQSSQGLNCYRYLKTADQTEQED